MQSLPPKMTVFRTPLRRLGQFLLGLAVLAGLLHFLVISNLTQRLVDEEVYYAAINDTDAYNRIYDEVLVDEALREQTDNLLGGVQLDVHDQAVAVLREILPPAYLQEQAEENIERFTSYMNGETHHLEIYLELEEPVERLLPTIQDHVSQVIDTLDIPKAAESLCESDAVRLLAADTAPLLERLSAGRLPESALALQPGNRDCREQAFDRWLDDVVNDPALDPRTSALLAESQEELRLPFIEGDTRALLQAAAEPLIGTLAKDAVANLQGELQPGDRLDLIQLAAEQNDDLTRTDIEESAQAMREAATISNGLGKLIALVVAAAGTLLLALIHRPNPANMIRWPGVTLAVSGVLCLAAGYALNSALPNILKGTAESESAPQSLIKLTGDLLESFGQQATSGFVLPATAVILVGAALIAASFLVNARNRRSGTVPQSPCA